MRVDSRVLVQSTAIFEVVGFRFRVSLGAHITYVQAIVSLATKR